VSEKSSIETVTVRRSPKYLRFFLFGVALGAIVALISATPLIGMPNSTGGIPVFQLVGFFVLFTGAVGGLIGLGSALIIDLLMRRSVRVADAKRTVTTESVSKP
jgi:hypothetical protein